MAIDHEKTSHHIIKSFEAEELKGRSWIILVADWLTSAFGSISFLIFNIFIFSGWIYINTGNIPEIPIFDPFPFTLLTMTVSLEAIILSIVVLMSQNKQSQISTLREELDMQVNLISEREITMALKLLKKMAEKMDVSLKNEEMEHMVEETDISYIQRTLQDQLKKETLPPLPNIPVFKNQKTK